MTQAFSPVQQAVQDLYDSNPEHEWQRMDRHPMEFAVTLRALADHLSPPPARILDCGGGPGRYAIKLARRGYQVTLFDLSPANLGLASAKAEEAGVQLAGIERGTATDLSRFADGSFDAVLLMGPLYHLLDQAERQQAVAEAYRVLRTGGLLVATFITRYAAHRWAAAFGPSLISEHRQRLDRVLATGQQPPHAAGDLTFVSYFAHPREPAPLFHQAGFQVETTLAVEGITSRIEDGINELSDEAWERWVDFNYHVASDPSLHSGADHLLVAGRKPRWRAVLRRFAHRLNQAGISYKIVGGTSLALHGVPVGVRDIDVETSAAGAYRVEGLWADYVVQPVQLLESATYRSHLGRLSIDGVVVEVMGDIQRPDGDSWTSTAALTKTMVSLDGEPVPVPWLEEEILAYVRRGRLARAGQGLAQCDQERMLALLRGQVPVGVL